MFADFVVRLSLQDGLRTAMLLLYLDDSYIDLRQINRGPRLDRVDARALLLALICLFFLCQAPLFHGALTTRCFARCVELLLAHCVLLLYIDVVQNQ